MFNPRRRRFMKLFIATLLIFTFTTQAVLADNVISVKTGDVVTKEYDGGSLLDREKANKIKDELIEKDGLVRTNESLNRSVKLYRDNEIIYNDQKKLLLDQNIELTKVLNDTRETSTFTKVLYFLGGVAITSAAVYGASRLAK